MLMAFNSVGELTSDPQLADEGFFRTVRHSGATLADAGPPYRFAGGLREADDAPALGEHTDEVLRLSLGRRSGIKHGVRVRRMPDEGRPAPPLRSRGCASRTSPGSSRGRCTRNGSPPTGRRSSR